MTSATGTPMNIAWNPGFSQYYGGGGGSSSYSGRVWNASGGILQTLTPINSDLRSFVYNANTGKVQEVTYSANSSGTGYLTVGLTGAGLLTGTYTNLGIALSGLPSNQTVPAYDSARNLFYGDDGGSIVSKVSAATGLSLGTVTLDLASAGTATIMTYAIAYDPTRDALISFTTTGGNRALAFSATTGAFLASISLSGLVSPTSQYGLGFANNQLFIYDSSLTAYRGYFLYAVPEPGTMALMVLGLSCLVVCQRRIRLQGRTHSR